MSVFCSSAGGSPSGLAISGLPLRSLLIEAASTLPVGAGAASCGLLRRGGRLLLVVAARDGEKGEQETGEEDRQAAHARPGYEAPAFKPRVAARTISR